MEINVNVAEGYVKNARNRRHQCERWSEWFGLMPLGEPITATQLAERISRAHDGSWYFTPSPQQVTAMLSAMKSTGAVTRIEVPIEPYEIKIEYFDGYTRDSNGCVVHNCKIKYITIDKKAMFIRMV